MYQPNFVLGVVFIILSEFMFTSMAATIKWVSVYLPNESIVFFRNLFVVLLLLPWIMQDGIHKLSTAQLRFHLLRSLAGVSAMYCFFYAISHMPLAEVSLLKQTTPFFMPLLSVIWLKEKVAYLVYWAIIVGFIGVAVILRPGADTFSPVALFALAGSALAALAKTTISRMSDTEPSERVVFYFALIATVVSAVPMLWAWVTPSWQAWLWLVVVSVFGLLGQLLMTRALMLASPSEIGTFSYVSVIFGSLYGWLFWSEWIDNWFLVGCGFIVLAGGIITYNHRKVVTVPINAHR